MTKYHMSKTMIAHLKQSKNHDDDHFEVVEYMKYLGCDWEEKLKRCVIIPELARHT